MIKKLIEGKKSFFRFLEFHVLDEAVHDLASHRVRSGFFRTRSRSGNHFFRFRNRSRDPLFRFGRRLRSGLSRPSFRFRFARLSDFGNFQAVVTLTLTSSLVSLIVSEKENEILKKVKFFLRKWIRK
jgi:hypothetical protein